MFLYDKLDALKQFQGKDFFQKTVQSIIKENLNSFITLREYQLEALGRFLFYYENYAEKPLPVHLLFNMATGSGKTVIMAGLILYLYQKGYRNFLFFVNATNIIEKTKDNFLNSQSIKYLFGKNLIINDERIQIKAVENFQGVNENDINIKFTTIQGLHSDITTPKENSLTIDDFQKSKIVILSDEAHHINASTKKLGKEDLIEKVTWEDTVTRILSSHIENIMLEFTATVDRIHPEIKKKYEDKTIYRYDLKQFRLDKFSKEVKTLQADVTPLQRMLQAIILSHYRRKIAEKNHIGLKPVVLIKSKTIKESEENFTEFKNLIQNLSSSDIEKIESISKNDDMQKARKRFSESGIDNNSIAKELKVEFDSTKLVEINGKQDSIDKQILVNTLEDPNNQIRCVFAVDMLNEGWDVLNLYDIVRLDESRAGPSGQGTVKEAQLIGRGARYYPFTINDTQDKYTRKYDEDISNELRVLEEMHYHCINNPKYIHELKKELEKIGIYDSNKREIEIKVKEEFKSSKFFQNAVLYVNKKAKSDRKHITTVFDANVKKEYTHIIKTGNSRTSVIFQSEVSVGQERRKDSLKLSDIEASILYRAIETIDDYSFERIKKYVGSFTNSIDELIQSNFSTITIVIDGGVFDNLSQEQKYACCVDVLQQIANDLKNGYSEYEGTKHFEHRFIHEIVTNKTISVSVDENNDRKVGKPMKEDAEYGYLDLNKKKRYIYEENYGTDEEKALVAFMDKFYETLKEKYTNIYLLRNEKLFQLYRFSDGKTLEPDFVLFADEKESKTPITYQLYIEPKGEHLIKTDSRKEDFLKQIEPGTYQISKMLGNSKYELYGLRFFNKARNTMSKDFEDHFTKVLHIE